MLSAKTLSAIHFTVGFIFLIMGILGLIPGIPLGSEPAWHAVLKIILGLIIIFAGYKLIKR